MQLTKAEEQVMQILWEMEEGLVKNIRDQYSDPKPARNTVSTVLRILEKKGFVDHKAYGNVHLYHPLITKSEYSKGQLMRLMEKYFNNSFQEMVSFYSRENNISIRELQQLIGDAKKDIRKNKSKKKK
jgi:BlaI family penicillinase repressor